MGKLILVGDLDAGRVSSRLTAVYARVSSADQRDDLDRQVARVCSWAEVDGDLVRDMTEVLTSFYARAGGRRAAEHRAAKALAAACEDDDAA